MGFWDNLKNKVNELNNKSEKWFKENIDDKIEEKKEEYKKELVCKNCGAKLETNILKETLVCEHCGSEQENPKYVFAKKVDDTKENSSETDNKEDK